MNKAGRIFLTAVSVSVFASHSSGATEFFVAPGGSDKAPGTFARPFKTLERARDAVREEVGDAIVWLRGGEDPVRQTIEFSEADSGKKGSIVRYRAWKDERPVLTGGWTIPSKAWRKAEHPLIPAAAKGNVWCADVRSLGAEALSADAPCGYGIEKPAFRIRSLYADGRRLTLARYPNEGFLKVVNRVSDSERTFRTVPMDCSAWSPENSPDLQAMGYWRWLWADQTQSVAVDPKTRILKLTGEPDRANHVYKGNPFCLQNSLAALDSPGEWYLDRSGAKLYVWPLSGGKPSERYELSVLGRSILKLEKAAYLSFEGIVFRCGRHHGIELTGSKNIVFKDCTVRDFGGKGLVAKGSSNIVVRGCAFSTFGHCAMELEGGDRRNVASSGIVVDSNDIGNTGFAMHTYTPGVWAEGCGHVITHNHFHDFPSSAMRIEGNEHLIASNLVERAVLESDDQGAADLWGDPTYRGNKFIHNIWRNIGNKAADSYCGQAAIRFDDAICGNLVYGNRFENCAVGKFGGVQINGGRGNVIRNNLFTGCEKGVSFISGWPLARWRTFLSQDNVKTLIAAVDGEVYRAKYPEWAGIADAPQINVVENNIFVGVKAMVFGKTQAGKRGVYCENPIKETVLSGNVTVDKEPDDYSAFAAFEPLPDEEFIGPRQKTAKEGITK